MGCGCTYGTTEVNTPSCENSSCTPTINSTTCSCGCSPCQCGRAQTAPVTPFYNAAKGVQETHTKTLVTEAYATALTTTTAFVVPSCGETVTITIPGLTKVQIGSYLWNPVHGYFEITSFDYISQSVTIKNVCAVNCVPGASAFSSPGTEVPSCTAFNVVDPPCTEEENLVGVYLQVDFVAPGNGNCVDIAVTSIEGLYVGQIVQLLSGQYRISAIVNSTTITICNDGSGITPGTVVDAIDANGNHLVPITPYLVNPCTHATQTSGAILTCHNNVEAPLSGNLIGQVPVLINASTNEVEFQTLNIPEAECTILTSCINLVAGVTVYIALVDDSSIFQLGDIVIIHDPLTEAYRFQVTDIIDATHIEITKTTAQTLNETVGCLNTPICLAPCCEQLLLGTQICQYDWSGAFYASSAQDWGTEATGVLDPGQSLSGNAEAIEFVNATCNNAYVTYSINTLYTGYFTDAAGLPNKVALVTFTPFFNYNVVAIGSGYPAPTYNNIVIQESYYLSSSLTGKIHYISKQQIYNYAYTLASGYKMRIYSYGYVTHNASDVPSTTKLHIGTVTALTGQAVAVQGAP